MEYKIILKKPTYLEEFEKRKDNVAEISIQKQDGHSITRQGIVSLSLSQDAMLELGKELICEAKRGITCDISHFYLSKPGTGISINYGIIIHPDSVEPIIEYSDKSCPIDTYINNIKKD